MAQIIIILMEFFIDLSHLFSGLIKFAFELVLSFASYPQKSQIFDLKF